MDRKMFEAGLFAKKEEMTNEAQGEALEMDKKRDELLADVAAKKSELAEIEGRPETNKEMSEILNFEQLRDKLKERGIDFNLEKAVDDQEKFWQKIYGSDLKIDRSKITKDAKLLKAIEAGFKNGCVNGIEIVVTSELSAEETKMTAFQQAFHKLLDSSGMNIWAKTGAERWTELELEELLQRALPVKCSDFNVEDLKSDWIKEFIRILDANGPAPKQKSNKVEFFFTDTRQDIPADQKLVNLDGEVVENPRSFIGAIANKISFTNPEEEVVMARQLYEKDKSYISRKFWEWLMAIVDHRDKGVTPSVSAASADSLDDGFNLYSYNADYSYDYYRLRVRL